MIVDNGFKIAINRINKQVPDYLPVTKFKIGTTQAVVTAIDTDLTLPVPLYYTDSVCDCEATTNWNVTTDGAIATTDTKYKIGTYALTLEKTGTTETNVTWYNQALTSLDFTNKDFWGWIYIDGDTLPDLAVTNCLEIRFGNDYDTNYYYKQYNKSNLVEGWNIIKFNTTTATLQGTVTLTACDSLAIKITLTDANKTIATDMIIIDDFKLASSDDYLRDFTAGYPTIDEITMESTTECYLTSTDANGYFIDGIGTFNTDSTPLMQDAFKYTGKSKSSSDEFIFVIKNRIKRR